MQREKRSFSGTVPGQLHLSRLRPIPRRRLRSETLWHLLTTFRHGGAEIVKRTRRAVPTMHTLASRRTARVQAPSQSPPCCGRHIVQRGGVAKQLRDSGLAHCVLTLQLYRLSSFLHFHRLASQPLALGRLGRAVIVGGWYFMTGSDDH